MDQEDDIEPPDSDEVETIYKVLAWGCILAIVVPIIGFVLLMYGVMCDGGPDCE